MSEYARELRTPDGKVMLEIFSSEIEFGSDCQTNSFTLLSPDKSGEPILIGRDSWVYNPTTDDAEKNGNQVAMPDWWRRPSNLKALCEKYEKGGKLPLLGTRNVVTFCPYTSKGQLVLQQRGFVAPNGKAIIDPGMLSLHGGLMEGDDLEQEACREAFEELGVHYFPDQFKLTGTLYDAERGRCNHVFRLQMPYDHKLAEQARGLPMTAVEALINPEGIGRAFVWREDLAAAMAAQMLAPISAAILEAFQELMPQQRPQFLAAA